MGKLKLNFSYSFNGKIWNIISGEDSDLLLLEVRETDKFKVTFSVLHLLTGDIVMKNKEFDENWWIGASYLAYPIILFHTYIEQDNPDFKKFFAYEIIEDKILWEKKEMKLIGSASKNLKVSFKGSDEMHYIDLLSGNEKQAMEADNSKNNSLIKPFYYQQETDHFKTVSLFIKNMLNLHVMKGAHYYEDKDFIFISYYYLNGTDKLANNLLVLNRKGDQLLHEKIGDDLPGIGDDTFFIYNDRLIFVKQYSDFLIYQLIRG